MDLSNALFLTTPIWVRLPSLPLELQHEDIFKGIDGSFGELIVADNAMASKSKLQSARLYVKVENLSNLPKKVELISKLGKRTQEITYEDLPNTCFAYKKYGHWVKNCLTKARINPRLKRRTKRKKKRFRRKFGDLKLVLGMK